MSKSLHRKSKIGFWLTLLVLLSMLQACDYAAEYVSYTRKEPQKSDLLGSWIPDKPTLQNMRAKGAYDPSVETKLTLRANGNFDLINMPDWWGDGFGHSQRGFKSSSGTWGVFQNTSTKFWEVGLESAGVQLLGQKAPYRLSFIIGDGDADQRMIFVKQ